MDKDLDQLLSLQSSVSEPSASQTGTLVEVPNKPALEEREELVQVEEREECSEEEREELVPEEEDKKQETQQAKEEIQKKEVVTEEDLEDWLDSMIS
ncbi:cell death regulator Aven-like isoform X1 [Salvelinus sp. IW2-2015]|uniref:cell death regulator Aven-like isoform X1 n=1 Tax=Salvelinus sp. IW2-2015 TaxID=2691554 RepID=UPI0038D517B0